MRWKRFAGNLFRHLERELKIRRRQAKEPGPIFRRRKLVEGEVAADDREGQGIFLQAGGFEELPRKAAARQIVAAAVDLPEPALILPGTAAQVNALGRERPQPVGEGLA